MDFIKELNKDLQNGFSKRDLEKLIGLPKNSLSNILRGNKKLSQKSKIKVEKWAASKKPDPLFLSKINAKNSIIGIQDVNKQASVTKPFEQPQTNYTINTIRHKKYKEVDPEEGSNSFFLKYGVFKYDDI